MRKKLRNLSGKRICIIGGFGFVGTHLAQKLQERNNVVLVGREVRRQAFQNTQNLEFQEFDITSPNILEYLTKESFHIVIHLAGTSAVWPSLKDPVGDFRANAQATLNILNTLSRKTTKPLFVYASSIAVYGVINKPITETDIPDPLSPYGVSKRCAESYTKIFATLPENSLKTLVLRFSSTFGPGQEKLFIYDMIKQFDTAQADKKPVVIKGTGNQKRDFNYVANLVDATIRSMEYSHFDGKIIDIGSGKEQTIYAAACKIQKLFPLSLKPTRTMQRGKGDAPNLFYDITKLKSCGFIPRTSFEEGLLKTVRWYKKKQLALDPNIFLSVILPTYNEKDNVAKTVARLVAFLPEITAQYEIIVVDDTSPDGTADIVRELQAQNSNIKLVMNPEKKGLGFAHKVGLDVAKGDILCLMDADGSQEPDTLIDFLYSIPQGVDLMIGSRYMQGGKVIGQDPKKKIASWIMNQFIRFKFGTGLADSTHSYRALSKQAYEKIQPHLKDWNHPGFCLDMTHMAKKYKMKIIEAPATFIEREIGDTKIPILKTGSRILRKIIFLRTGF